MVNYQNNCYRNSIVLTLYNNKVESVKGYILSQSAQSTKNHKIQTNT